MKVSALPLAALHIERTAADGSIGAAGATSCQQVVDCSGLASQASLLMLSCWCFHSTMLVSRRQVLTLAVETCAGGMDCWWTATLTGHALLSTCHCHNVQQSVMAHNMTHSPCNHQNQ